AARSRIAGEETLEIAGCAVEVAEQEPGDVVEDMVQPGDQQQAVKDAIEEQPQWSGTHHPATERVDANLEPGESEAEQDGTGDAGQTGGNRNETASGEES